MSSASIWTPLPSTAENIEGRWPGRMLVWNTARAGRELEARGFRPLGALVGGRFSVAVAGIWEGIPAVARLDPDPDYKGASAAAQCLAHCHASPEILHEDSSSGVLVLARIDPGLTGYEVRPAPALLGETLAKLRTAEHPQGLPSLSGWLRARLGGPTVRDAAPNSAPTSSADRTLALALLSELSTETGAAHGDCSPGNLLLGDARWWLIDPRGVQGDWHYDVAVAAWKCDYSESERRSLVAACGADPKRVEAWEKVAKAARV